MLVNKCCVPNYKSNYDSNSEKGYVTRFKFPTDKTLQEKWLRKIQKKNLGCQNIQLLVSNIFKNVTLLNITFYLKKMLFLSFFQTYVLICQFQLPLYNAPAHQNVANKVKNTIKFCKNNGLTSYKSFLKGLDKHLLEF